MSPKPSLAKAVSRRFAVVFFLASVTSIASAIVFSGLYRDFSDYYSKTLPATIAASNLRESALHVTLVKQRLAATNSELIHQSLTMELRKHMAQAMVAIQALRKIGLHSATVDEIERGYGILSSNIEETLTLADKRIAFVNHVQDMAARLNQISRSSLVNFSPSSQRASLQARVVIGHQIRLLLGLSTELDRGSIERAEVEFRKGSRFLDGLLPTLQEEADQNLTHLHNELNYLGIGGRDAFRFRMRFLDMLDKVEELDSTSTFLGNQVSDQIGRFEKSLEESGAKRLAELADNMLRFYWLLLLPPLATVFLGLEAFRYIQRRVIRNIERLEANMRLNADGTVCAIEITSPLQEVASMERSAAIFLEKRTEAERRLVAAQTDLRHALARAEAGERSKSDFLAKISHELRTPLHAIMGYAHLLRQRLDPASNLDSYARSIEAGSTRLLAQIEEILYFSKFGSADYHVKLAPCRIRHVFSEVADSARLRASQVNLQLAFKPGDKVPELVLLNEELLRQILENLISNAIKYTEKGQVLLTSDYKEGRLLMSVQDTGIGISAEDRERMFLPFVQLGQLKEKRDGVGLGLAIVHGAVQRLNGSIGIDEAPGGGTIFFVSIPCAQVVDDAATRSAPDDQRKTAVCGMAERAKGDRSAAGGSAPLAKVLVAEDEPVLAELEREILEFEGYQVTLASTGEEAYAYFLAAPKDYALLISDQRMPGMQGTELIDKVLQLRPELPVVLISGDKDIIGNKSFTRANFRHLQKPVPADLMLATLKTLLQQSCAG